MRPNLFPEKANVETEGEDQGEANESHPKLGDETESKVEWMEDEKADDDKEEQVGGEGGVGVGENEEGLTKGRCLSPDNTNACS